MSSSPTSPQSAHPDDPHLMSRSRWLRAAVLGANDGIVSVSSLIVGVAASGAGQQTVALAGLAGLSAGAMSMAAGEYVSVRSQSDIECADIRRESKALRDMPDEEMAELARIWQARGLSHRTAMQVARELHDHDPLAAHLRDEIGLFDIHSANPLEAAFTSGLTFSLAAALPIIAAWLVPAQAIIAVVLIATLAALMILGALGAWAGGAPMGRAIGRVVLWGCFAMAVTAGVGRIFGVAV